MRWVVICLILSNVVFLLWNWLGYSHARDISALNSDSGYEAESMPGFRLTMLKERPDVAPVQASGGAVSQEPPSPNTEIGPGVGDGLAAINADECLLLGPIADAAAAKPLLDRLAALQITGNLTQVEIEGEADYWVYLPPEATRDLAIVKLRELQEKKIDSFIIPEGDLANGVSLGVFDKKENAEKRKLAISEMGYDAQLSTKPRKYLENWVVIQPAEAAKFSPELYESLKGENGKLDMRKDPCGKVAPKTDIQ